MTEPLPGFEGVVVGHEGLRRKADYYPTPPWAVLSVLPILRLRITRVMDIRPPIIIEPAMGHGTIATILAADRITEAELSAGLVSAGCRLPHPMIGKRATARWKVVGLDIEEKLVNEATAAGLEGSVGDFGATRWSEGRVWCDDRPLTERRNQRPAVVGNPPYEHAEGFVRKGIELAGPTGIVAMLLRLGFSGSQTRAPLHRELPSDMLVLDRRPSFTGGGTDTSDYAWFIYPPDGTYGGSVTPRGVRRGTIWREGDFDDV